MAIKRLLIIDDDDDDRQSILQAIDKILPGSQCQQAQNGKEGLAKLKGVDPKPDLILLDLNMPLMNGFEFLREMFLNESISQIPVIMLSTSSSPDTQKKLSVFGDVGYIVKPDTEGKLVSNLRKAFGVNG